MSTEIERIVALLEEKTDEYRTFAVEAAQAEVVYKKSYAIALLRAEGTAGQRDAEATLKAAEEFMTRRTTEATRDACLEAMRSLRAQLSALQSLLRFESGQS